MKSYKSRLLITTSTLLIINFIPLLNRGINIAVQKNLFIDQALILNDINYESKMVNDELLIPVEVNNNPDTSLTQDDNITLTLDDPSLTLRLDTLEINDNNVELSNGENFVYVEGLDTTKENDVKFNITSDGGINEQYSIHTLESPEINFDSIKYVTNKRYGDHTLIPKISFDIDVVGNELDYIELSMRGDNGYFESVNAALTSPDEMKHWHGRLVSGDEGQAATPKKVLDPKTKYDYNIKVMYDVKEGNSGTKDISKVTGSSKDISFYETTSGLMVKEPSLRYLYADNITSSSASIEYDIDKGDNTTSSIYDDAEIVKLELVDLSNGNVIWKLDSKVNPISNTGVIELNNLESYNDYKLQFNIYYNEEPNNYNGDQDVSEYSRALAFRTYSAIDNQLPSVTETPTVDNGDNVWMWASIPVISIIVASIVVVILKRK